jgi:Zn-dependent peptidase ImmA (M78 family)
VLDQEHTLTAVEALHSRMPLEIEGRAKAFAGEFLLPGDVTAGLWQKAKSPRSLGELDKFVAKLSHDFGVTKNVAAWKLEHDLIRTTSIFACFWTRSPPTDSAGGPSAIEKKAPPIDAASCLGQSRASQDEVGEAPT